MAQTRMAPPASSRRTTRIARSVLLGCLASLGSCIWFDGDHRVFVSSDPPGAEVLLDGESTGKTTPAILELDGLIGSDYDVTVRKRGFESETRTVVHYSKFGTSQGKDAIVDTVTPCFPFFWTAGDFFFPFEAKWTYVPHNLYVKLFPEGTFRPKPGKALSQDSEAARD